MIKAIMLLTKFIIAVSIALLMNSCNIKADFGNGVDGNGKITTEVRNISNDFSSIDVNSGIEVIVSQSDDQFVSVETDSNLQKLITTKVENGVLIIEPTEPVNETQTIKVTVRMRKIEILEASSGSKIRSSGSFKGENISIDTSSAAEVDVNLKYDNITYHQRYPRHLANSLEVLLFLETRRWGRGSIFFHKNEILYTPICPVTPLCASSVVFSISTFRPRLHYVCQP